MPGFFEVVRSQRACRSFRPDPVDDSLLASLLEAATFAPSAENRQPWVFVVVRDEARRRAIGELTARAWSLGAKAYSQSRLDPSLLEAVDRGATGGVAEAPVLVVVGGDCGDSARKALEASVFPATQNLLLAASALGLGSALTTLPLVFGEELARLVGFPSEVIPVAVVPIGWPARELGPPRRKAFSAKAHRETYGAGW